MRTLLAALTVIGVGLTAKGVAGDAKRGAELIKTQGCVNCHRIGGEGGSAGPDLGKARGRNYTPASMASAMWNHAPAMWTAMDKAGTAKPQLNEQQAADVFAYFHSIRYFDQPGDAARGRRVFMMRRCGECHGREKALYGGAPAVKDWKGLASPVAFAQQMWNHAPAMEKAMAERKVRWSPLTTAELTDILVYLQGLPETRGLAREYALTSTGRGEALFAEKGCKTCHQGKLLLDGKLAGGTTTDFAVAMWNHAPIMSAQGKRSGITPPKLGIDEMQEILAYLSERSMFAEAGNAGRGKDVFAKKNCAACHGAQGGGAPDLSGLAAKRGDAVRPFSMMAVLWQHGPAMLKGMEAKKLAWPGFTKQEMLDLIAFLNTGGKTGAAD